MDSTKAKHQQKCKKQEGRAKEIPLPYSNSLFSFDSSSISTLGTPNPLPLWVICALLGQGSSPFKILTSCYMPLKTYLCIGPFKGGSKWTSLFFLLAK